MALLWHEKFLRPLDPHDTGFMDDNLDDAKPDPFDLLLHQRKPPRVVRFSVHTRTVIDLHNYVNHFNRHLFCFIASY